MFWIFNKRGIRKNNMKAFVILLIAMFFCLAFGFLSGVTFMFVVLLVATIVTKIQLYREFEDNGKTE